MRKIQTSKAARQVGEQAKWVLEDIRASSQADVHGYYEEYRQQEGKPHEPMTAEWQAFQRAANSVHPQGDARYISLALQHLGKTVTGLAVRTGLTLWRMGTGNREECTDKAVVEVWVATLGNVQASHHIDSLAETRIPDFRETLMGRMHAKFHTAYMKDVLWPESLHYSVLAAAQGMLAWRAYREHLNHHRIDDTLPKPGEPSGTILPWTS